MLNHTIIRTIILGVLLLWTAGIVWTILRDPLNVEPGIILPALICAAGFVGLARWQKTHRHK